MFTLQADKTIKVWDMNTGECIKSLVGHSSHVTSVCWIPGDTKRLVSGRQTQVLTVGKDVSGITLAMGISPLVPLPSLRSSS